MKKKHLIIVLPLLLLLGVAIFSVRSFVTAQSAGQVLEISPPSQDVAVDPGKTITVKATIRNQSNNTLPIKVRIEDFTAKGDEGQIELTANSPYSIVSWTKVTPESFPLAVGEEQEVTATVTAPSDAAGGHFGSFVFSVKPDNVEGNATSVSQEIASLFLVKVSGPIDEKLSIKTFTSPAFSEFGPVPFAITFNNSGNVHIKTFGLVNVTDMFGKKVEDIVVTGTNVFPGAERVVKPSLNKQFLFGNYSATAIMYYGSQNQTLTATTTFFVFPARIAAVILGILFLLYLMRKRLRKSLKALFK